MAKEEKASEHKALKVGDKIPPFLAKDQEGFDVTDEDVIGTPLVIYFYPKDGTSVCTDEACAFRDNMAGFDEKQALVIGISPDGKDSHQQFLKEHRLDFSLLSDEDKEMFRSFGALKGDEIVRTTFVVNSEGEVKWMEKPVDVNGHVQRVLKALEEHCSHEVVSFDDYDKDYEKFMGETLGDAPDEQKIRQDILKKFNLNESDLGEK